MEALRYRLRVRLGQVIVSAQAAGDEALRIQAESLRQQLLAVPSEPNMIPALEALEPGVAALEAELGLLPYGPPRVPKWLRYSAVVVPVLGLLLVLLVVFERRRRKKAVSEAAMANLEASVRARSTTEPGA